MKKIKLDTNKIIHGAGQSLESFRKYWDAVEEEKPVLYMFYLRIDEISKKLPEKVKEMNSVDKRLIPQIALNLKVKEKGQQLKEIVNEEYNAELAYLAKYFKNIKKPVFLRIGYEFNNPQNNYSPSEFIVSWKYILDFFRKKGVKNVFFVWDCCSAFNQEVNQIMEFYPGDDYVDWFGNNFFGIKSFIGNKNKVTEDFYKEAIAHKKPLMICECSPARIGVEKGEKSWNLWFKPFFQWIDSHPDTKSFCYINWDWAIDWKSPEWGNGRIEENEFVRKKYIQELKKPKYLNLK